MFLAALFTIAPNWKQSRPSTTEWVKHGKLYHGILFSNRKRGTTNIYNDLHESLGNYAE